MADRATVNNQRKQPDKRPRPECFDDSSAVRQRTQIAPGRIWTDDSDDTNEIDDDVLWSPTSEERTSQTGFNISPINCNQLTRPSRRLFKENLYSNVRNLSQTTASARRSDDIINLEPQVKKEETECNAWLKDTPSDEHVTIYVGKENRQVKACRDVLSKSPVLEAFIVQDNVQGYYVMRPQLLTINYSHFLTLLQFMHWGEYAPVIMTPDETGKAKYFQHRETRKEYSDDEYSAEVVREGHLYVLAKQFQVEGLADKVREKICEVDSSKYTIRSLLELAAVVLNKRHASYLDGGGLLEQWIIDKLASNFREIMKQEQDLFWRMERNTSKQCLFVGVFDAVAQSYRRFGGLLPHAGVVVLD